MDEYSPRWPLLEKVLWVLTIVLAFVAVGLFALNYLNYSPSRDTSAAIRPTVTPRPTLTPLAKPSPIAAAPSPKSRTPIPVPTPATNAKSYTFPADPLATGWIGSDEKDPHWGDRNLHAGTYRGQVYQSVIAFDISSLAPGTKILYAHVELPGLNRNSLGATGTWSLKLLPASLLSNWSRRPSSDFRGITSLGEIGGGLGPEDLAEDQANQFVFSQARLQQLEQSLNDVGRVLFRLDGPAEAPDSLFTWDAGDGDLNSPHPVLRMVAVPGQFVLVPNTPTPQNVLTAAAMLVRATESAMRFGTSTPLPRKYVTPTPLLVVTAQPTPENVQTVRALSAYATAVALTTGTFTPTPLNLVTVTPTPANTPTAVFLTINQLTPEVTLTPRVEISWVDRLKTPIPAESGIVGSILFYTDRENVKEPQIYVMNRDGAVRGKLTGNNLYLVATARDLFSPERNYQLDVSREVGGLWKINVLDLGKMLFSPLIVEDANAKGIGVYHPSWSRTGDRVAFVSERTGYSEIYVFEMRTGRTTRLTYTERDPKRGYPPYNKHPSWSPDDSKIIFSSDRNTDPPRYQLYVMNPDGSDLRNFSPDGYNNWDPVWVKN